MKFKNFSISKKPISIAWKLFVINAIVLIVGLFINDPWGFFHSDYSNAETFLINEKEIVEIRILSSRTPASMLGWNVKLNKDKDISAWQISLQGHILHADSQKIEKFLDTLRNLRKFTELGKVKEDYGFDDESYLLEIKFANGKTTKIEVSSEMPQSGGSYICDEIGSIYFVPDSLNTIFNNQDYSYFADRSIFSPLPFDSITTIELSQFNPTLGKQESFLLIKDSGFWFLKEDLQIKVNPDSMQDILMRLNGLEIQKFVFNRDNYWKPLREYSIHYSSNLHKNGKTFELKCKWLDDNENTICQKEAMEYIILDRYNLEKIFSYSKKELIDSKLN